MPALISQAPETVGVGLGVGEYCAAFSGGDLFVGIEAEDREIAEGADAALVDFGTDGFAGVLDDDESMVRGEFAESVQNVALFVSQYLHCLADLLHRHQTHEIQCNLALIVSNHESARPLAEFHGPTSVMSPVFVTVALPKALMPLSPSAPALLRLMSPAVLVPLNVDT